MGERSETQNTTSIGYRHTILCALLAESSVCGAFFDRSESTYFCNEQLTNSNRSFLYDAEIVAGSPLKFEKHPQESFFREQTLCKNKPQPNGHFQ
jgi:hypothetical protein